MAKSCPLINVGRQSSKQLLSLESFSRIFQLPVPDFSQFIGLPVAAGGRIEGSQPADANKGRREQLIPLHPLVIQHLKPLTASFSPFVFPWNHNSRTLWAEFARIQEAAKLADKSPMPKAGKNGGWYGFHDLRRGFATINAGSMDLFELQALIQHKSLTTTQGYVSMATRLQKPVNNLFVPSLPTVSETA